MVYSDYKWEPWRFLRPPRGAYKDPTFIDGLLSEVERKLMIDSPEKWYRVSKSDLRVAGASILLTAIKREGSLFNVLATYRPMYALKPEMFKTIT